MSNDIDYERLYRDVLPSVVSVYVRDDDPRRGGAGSGFVYDADGHLVTNEHVVGDTDEVEVRLDDGEWRVGRVVGTDADTDLAVLLADGLPPEAAPLPVAEENPVPGRPVAALGNPMGLDGTITAGIVSGTNRSMAAGEGFAIPDVVQTDAAINPGNSGGPLVAVDGDAYEIVGVNRAKAGDNIGFAVSPALVSRVVPDLVEAGECRHATLHVSTLDVSPTVAAANDVEPGGVLVVDVRDGPAAGVLKGCTGRRRIRGRAVPTGGDVILGIDGTDLRSHEELMRHLLTEVRPDDAVTLRIRRDGTERDAEVTVTDRANSDGDDGFVDIEVTAGSDPSEDAAAILSVVTGCDRTPSCGRSRNGSQQ